MSFAKLLSQYQEENETPISSIRASKAEGHEDMAIADLIRACMPKDLVLDNDCQTQRAKDILDGVTSMESFKDSTLFSPDKEGYDFNYESEEQRLYDEPLTDKEVISKVYQNETEDDTASSMNYELKKNSYIRPWAFKQDNRTKQIGGKPQPQGYKPPGYKESGL